MPITVKDQLPAKKILEEENIFVMGSNRALHQDIRPLRIGLVNLMPTTFDTETQIIRMLSNTPLQIEFELLRMASHTSKHTSSEHFKAFYKTFDEIKSQRFDGMIITGAPVEQLPFEEVDYWQELTEIMQWIEKNVTSTLFLCWGAQAALYYYYGIPKYKKKNKIFGVFSHHIVNTTEPLLRGFDEGFFIPHSRHTDVKKIDIQKVRELHVLAEAKETGVSIAATKNGSKIFITGHLEYDAHTLEKEYRRDVSRGLPIAIPKSYFPDDDPKKKPVISWRSNGFLLYSNWLNYYVYQTTPYNWVTTEVTET